MSGFTHRQNTRDPPFPRERCESTTTITQTTTTSATTVRPLNDTDVKINVFAHKAIVVQWHKSETKSLPYSLPKVPKPTLVHSWTPGTEVHNVDGGAGNNHFGGTITSGAIIAVAVVCSVIGFVLLIAILWCVKRRIEAKPPRVALALQGTELLDNRKKRVK